MNRLDDAFFTLTDTYSDLRRYKADNENAEEIENFEIDETKRTNVNIANNLKIKDLNFSYPETSALEDVTLEIKTKEKIALIGQSGSGKTTFLKVLHGLYENAHADLTIDGKKYDENFDQLDLHTTLVPQEPELFSSTVTENITFGLDYTDEQVRRATDLAHFTDVAEQLPNGFDSKINEKGVNLSGGQKQRLALARALLFAEDKDIVLLDESTSSVDPETENKIYKNLFETYPDKTFLASIHKLNLLKYFDRIVVFESGRIIADGTFDELLQTNDSFKNMWEEFVRAQ